MKQNLLLFLITLPVIIMSCSGSKKSTYNNLSKEEKNKGWKLLFDGKTMEGWRTYQNKPADSWTVNNGVLYCKGSTTTKSDKRADLITQEEFENFDLSLDWKISPQGNRGIMYMVTEEFPAAYLSGP